jgi:hypothetical protein
MNFILSLQPCFRTFPADRVLLRYIELMRTHFLPNYFAFDLIVAPKMRF